MDNLGQRPHIWPPSHLVSAVDPVSCAEHQHMHPPFRYSSTESMAVVLKIEPVSYYLIRTQQRNAIPKVIAKTNSEVPTSTQSFLETRNASSGDGTMGFGSRLEVRVFGMLLHRHRPILARLTWCDSQIGTFWYYGLLDCWLSSTWASRGIMRLEFGSRTLVTRIF